MAPLNEDTMHCLRCQYENPDKAKFCMECGFSFIPASKIKSIDSSFEKKIKTSIKEGERKQASVLFSDLSGYTAMTELMDPEEIKSFMGDIFEKIGEIAEKYQGTVERFFGDEILILFGVPKVHEDDPIRAVHTAIEIHELMEKLSPEFEKKYNMRLRMHTGVNSGLVITGDKYIGKGRHGLTGDTINLAKRLTGNAAAGEIVIGYGTFIGAKHNFNFHTLEPVKVKGKTESVKIYRVIGTKTIPKSNKSSFSRQISSEMVGREKELKLLECIMIKAINKNGSIINVIGEAGIGKSRLLQEFKNLDIVKEITLLQGKTISFGRNLAFHPIIDLIKNWAEIKEDDSEIITIEKLEFAIRKAAQKEAEGIFPFIATVMGMKLSGNYAQRVEGIEGEPLEKLIFKNIRQLLTQLSKGKPVVIVIEDLHWADSSSIELMEILFKLSKSNRITFINIFRPGHKETSERIVDSVKKDSSLSAVTLQLEPLDKLMSETLINNTLEIKGLPYEIKNKIIDRTGGNPFFIEEVVRSFIDEQVIVLEKNQFIVTEKINTITIPRTINDVITARIDRLENETKDLLKIASVIGRNFYYKILTQIETNIEFIEAKLSYLRNIQLIRERIHNNEREYIFIHALAQEAVYNSILLEKRKQIHLQVAVSIENIFKDRIHEFYGMLALHYGMGENLDKAEEYMAKAGEEALKTSASSEALNYLQEALKLYLIKYGKDADPLQLVKYETNIAKAYFNKAQWKDALFYFETALKRLGVPLLKSDIRGFAWSAYNFFVFLKVLYLKLPDSKKIPTSQDLQIMDLYTRAGETAYYADRLRLFFGCFDLIRRTTAFNIAQTPQIPNIWSAIAGGLATSGILPLRLCSRLLDISKPHIDENDVRTRLARLVARSIIHLSSGELYKVKTLDEELLNESLRLGEFFYLSTHLWWYGVVKLQQGEFKSLNSIIDELIKIGEMYDNKSAKDNAVSLRIAFLTITRKPRKLIAKTDKMGLNSLKKTAAIIFLSFRAEAQQLIGDVKSAHESIEKAVELHKNKSIIPPNFLSPYLAACLFIQVENLNHQVCSNKSSNVRHLKKQINKSVKHALKTTRKYAPDKIKIFRLVGKYYWIIGKQRKALKWWNKAIRESELLGTRPDLSRTYFEVGKSIQSPQSKYKQLNGITAREYLDKARVMFEEMDLQWDLNEFQKASAAEKLECSR